MDRLRPAGFTALAVRISMVLAAAGLVVAAALPRSVKPAVTGPGVATGGAGVQSAGAVAPAANYPGITERPLFNANRRPWAGAPPAAPVPTVLRPMLMQVAAPVMSGVVLVGIIRSGDARIALLHVGNAPTATTLQEGQQVQGWTLQQINADHLHFERAGVELDIFFPKSK